MVSTLVRPSVGRVLSPQRLYRVVEGLKYSGGRRDSLFVLYSTVTTERQKTCNVKNRVTESEFGLQQLLDLMLSNTGLVYPKD